MFDEQKQWLVDGHVHFHRLDLVAPTLDAAAANFRVVGGDESQWQGALLLTQTRTERVFEALQERAQIGNWQISQSDAEPESLTARRDGVHITIVCGRQVRAADGLEVLALGTRENIPDGLPFAEAIASVQGTNALTVLPWGFGKWLGARGNSVERVLKVLAPESLFIGDNGSRLQLTGVPPLVRAAERNGFRVLPGTDPFPFSGGYRRVGRFGFLANIGPAGLLPWNQLRNWLLSRRQSPQPYGAATGVMSFVFNQVGIQVYNRFVRGGA